MKKVKLLMSFIVLIIFSQVLNLNSMAQSACPSGGDFLFCAGKLNTGGNYGCSVAQIKENCSIIAAGATNNYGSGNYDILLVGVDINGVFSWAKTIGGIGDDMGGQIDTTFDGGYIVAGSTKSWGAITNSDVLLMKFNSSNNVVWSKVFGSNTINESVVALAPSIDSGYYVLCQNFDDYDGILYKTDSAGAVLWAKHLGSDTTIATPNDYFQDMKATADGGCIVTGWSWSYRLPGAPGRQEIVEKFSSTGTLEWAKIIGYGADGLGGLDGHSVAQISSGEYLLGGVAINGVLTKLNTAGNLVWSKETDHLIYPNRMISTSDDGLFISGVSLYWHPNSKISRTFVKLNSLMNIEWTRTDNILDSHPNPWDNGGFALELQEGFLTVANTHKHTDAYAETNLCIEKFQNDGTTCYSNPVTATMTNYTVLVTDITSAVQVYLKNLSYVTNNPSVTPASQTIDSWTDCSTPTGIRNELTLNDNEISVYPNPSLDIIHISLGDFCGNCNVDVLNSCGQVILSKKINNQPSAIVDLSKQSGGMYFIKVQTENKLIIRKVIVE